MRTRRRVMVRRTLVPRRVRNHPLTRALAVAAVIAVGAAITQHVVTSINAARHRWGEERTVVVAHHRIERGSIVEIGDVASDTWPAGLVPSGAVEVPPIGQTVIATIEPGEVVVRARLAPDGLTGLAALVPAGWRAIAIPVAPTVLTLHAGDHVDLIAGFDVASTDAGGPPALTVARDAIVVAVDDQRVSVAVRGTDIERAAFAVIAGTVVPVLRTP